MNGAPRAWSVADLCLLGALPVRDLAAAVVTHRGSRPGLALAMLSPNDPHPPPPRAKVAGSGRRKIL